MRFKAKIPSPIIALFPSLIWKIKTRQKIIFLTFDDGPIPDVTPWVLGELKKFNAKASFFCIGSNVKKHPKIFEAIKAQGHFVGNHTHNHLNGSNTKTDKYLDDVSEASKYVNTLVFRPPYGRIKRSQRQALLKHYKIVMWHVLSEDYDKKLRGLDCYNNVVRNAKAGSIVVFHDSIKAEERLRVALPKVLSYFSGKGYKFESIENYI